MAGPEVLLIGGAMLGAGGSYFEGKANEASAQYNARLALQNAALAKMDAREDAKRYRRNTQRKIGTFRAAAGASGIRTSGSFLEGLADFAVEEELAAQDIVRRGKIEAMGYKANAAAQAAAGSAAKKGGIFSAGAKLLGGLGGLL